MICVLLFIQARGVYSNAQQASDEQQEMKAVMCIKSRVENRLCNTNQNMNHYLPFRI